MTFPKEVIAEVDARMAEPIEETRRKAIKAAKFYAGRKPLICQLKYNYAMARLWHIENGIPLPPCSNGNYTDDGGGVPIPQGNGNRQLMNAWIAAGKPEVCRDEIMRSDSPYASMPAP
jgi:hypothetical protein